MLRPLLTRGNRPRVLTVNISGCASRAALSMMVKIKIYTLDGDRTPAAQSLGCYYTDGPIQFRIKYKAGRNNLRGFRLIVTIVNMISLHREIRGERKMRGQTYRRQIDATIQERKCFTDTDFLKHGF